VSVSESQTKGFQTHECHYKGLSFFSDTYPLLGYVCKPVGDCRHSRIYSATGLAWVVLRSLHSHDLCDKGGSCFAPS